jgi:hypothetical protein
MAIIKDRFIKKEEFSKLLFNMLDGMDTHDLSMWVKSKTDEEWVVVPREFCANTITFFEMEAPYYIEEYPEVKKLLDELIAVKNYL